MQSRRSNTNLSNLTVTPLSTRNSLDDDELPFNDQSGASRAHQGSYISGKSAPTTPGILSRSPSRTRLGHSSSTKLASSKSYTQLTLTNTSTDLSKSKSTPWLTPGGHPPRKRSKPRSSPRLQLNADPNEWLYRAGTAISSEARESKGQSWLVSRESSTSLVAQDQDADNVTPRALDLSAAEFAPPYSARTSRGPSRTASAVRVSKPGSRTDLYFGTPRESQVALSREMSADDYFGRVQPSMPPTGPDFVDAEEEDDDDEDEDFDVEAAERSEEDEVARLTSEKGSGLGGIVDRLLGWTLFDVEEDGRESEEEEDVAAAGPKQPPPREQQTQAAQQSHITSHAAPRRDADHPEGQGGWADAAWLLSVASKVIL